MLGYTYLNDEEKLQSLIYMSEHMMVSREELREKEIEIMEVFLENFIKESDYDKLTIFSVKFNQGVIILNGLQIILVMNITTMVLRTLSIIWKSIRQYPKR